MVTSVIREETKVDSVIRDERRAIIVIIEGIPGETRVISVTRGNKGSSLFVKKEG